MSMLKKMVVCSGGALVALAAGSGIAAAQPDVESIVNSTCTYPQVMAALNAQSPEAAGQIGASPVATSSRRARADRPSARVTFRA